MTSSALVFLGAITRVSSKHLPAQRQQQRQRLSCEICLKLTEDAKRCEWRWIAIYIVNFEHLSSHVLLLL